MRIMNRWVWVGMLLAVGCTSVPPPPGEALQSKVSRITTAPSAQALSATIEGNTAAGLALYGGLIEADQNLFFSPHSIITVLGLTYGGAQSATKTEFEALLRAPNAEDFHRSMNHLEREFATRGSSSQGANGAPFALTILDQLFVDSTLSVEPAYLDLLQHEYGAGVRQLDFIGKSAEATQKINEWVSTATRQRIPAILESGDVTRETRMVLVNAMYFSAAWASNFDASRTSSQSFHGLPGDAQVPMMRQIVSTQELENDEVEAVELDYSGNELSMLLIMPKGDFRAWESHLDLAALAGVRDGLAGARLDLSMPQFETRSRRDLQPPLEARGLKTVFDPEKADLSGMSDKPLYLDFLRHEAWIDVSEAGTRAAAATAGGGRVLTSARPEPKQVIFDRPFFYLVQDKATKAVLFMGRFVAAP